MGGTSLRPKLHVAVIGAGPAGLTAAYQLAKQGHRVEVFEGGDAVGGMAKTMLLWGQLVDLGPHRFFSSDPRVNSLWLEVIGTDYSMVKRLTRIYYQQTFFDYPLKPYNALRGLGITEAMRCVLSYVRARLRVPADMSTFEGWVTSRFGYRLFEIFFKTYSEKLWGIRCQELDADFAAQRIKKLSLLGAVVSALKGNRGNKHKTLVDEFAYPHEGAGLAYERMAASIQRMGGSIHLRCPVTRARATSPGRHRPSVQCADGREQEFDHVISTMPLTKLIAGMDAPEDVKRSAASLRFRNTILVYLELDCSSPFPDQWIYVHCKSLRTGRVTNFSNWVPSIRRGQENTILCLEFWCNSDESIWREQEDILTEFATREIESTGLVPTGRVRRGRVVRVPNCYPIYMCGYKDHLRVVERFLREQGGLTVIGRYGSFKYNNQDHSILMGIFAAENIGSGAAHDLWMLNTDYEYQESSRIVATGLARG